MGCRKVVEWREFNKMVNSDEVGGVWVMVKLYTCTHKSIHANTHKTHPYTHVHRIAQTSAATPKTVPWLRMPHVPLESAVIWIPAWLVERWRIGE